MKKGYLIGGLAIVGTIALISLFKKPKRNSEGFFGANGTGTNSRWCARRNPNGSVTYIINEFSPTCGKGWKAVKYFGDRTGI
jgi:hypothetical protein